MNKLKYFVKKFAFGKKASEKDYLNYLKSLGIKIGDNVRIYTPNKVLIDEQYPWLMSIGNSVIISEGVRILTHSYEWCVTKHLYAPVLGVARKVEIGNNVFIGMNSTILGGVNIGNNVIIGSNSLVCKNLPSNSVCAGNPAKVICTIEEYYEKIKSKQVAEAKELAKAYYDRIGKLPPKDLFHEFFFLFEPRKGALYKTFNDKLKLKGNYEQSKEAFYNSKPIFNGYEDFINEAIFK